MKGFNKLHELKDNMLKPIYEKRRHLGCEWCGTTFYGYYTKQSQTLHLDMPDVTEEGVEIFLPPCPDKDCGMGTMGIYSAKTALHHYNKHKEKERKKAERKAKKDAEPVKVSKKLTYPNKKAYEDRIDYLAANPDEMTKYEIMSSYFMDKLFWKIFGKGCHVLEVRNFTVKKELYDGTYMSNSGKSRMGYFTPYFKIINNQNGKVRVIGTDSVTRHIQRKEMFGTNRRNDPERGYGLPNSRGYR